MNSTAAHIARRNAKAQADRYPREHGQPPTTPPIDLTPCHYCQCSTDAPAYYIRMDNGQRLPVCILCETYIDNSVMPV